MYTKYGLHLATFHTSDPILRHRNANDLFWKSWHFIIEDGEASKFPWDFTSILVENLNYVFIMIILKLIYSDAPLKKPVSVQDLTVKDKRGRQRFHGAFTGGFSAGYFNSVGSKDGKLKLRQCMLLSD